MSLPASSSAYNFWENCTTFSSDSNGYSPQQGVLHGDELNLRLIKDTALWRDSNNVAHLLVTGKVTADRASKMYIKLAICTSPNYASCTTQSQQIIIDVHAGSNSFSMPYEYVPRNEWQRNNPIRIIDLFTSDENNRSLDQLRMKAVGCRANVAGCSTPVPGSFSYEVLPPSFWAQDGGVDETIK